MPDNVSKHSEKVTINLTTDDYKRLIDLQDKSGEPLASIAKKMMLEGLDSFTNPTRKALSLMRG